MEPRKIDEATRIQDEAQVVNERLARLHRRLFLAKERLNARLYQKFKLWLWGIEQLQRETDSGQEVLVAATQWESELNAEMPQQLTVVETI